MEESLLSDLIADAPKSNATSYFISETTPYFMPLCNVDNSINGELTTTIGCTFEYYGVEFGKLLQSISSIGSCCVSKKLGAANMQYFLGEKLRIRRCGYFIKDGQLKVVVLPIVQSNKRAKAIIDIYDETDAIAYRFELDYSILPESTFSKLFKKHFYQAETTTFIETMPKTTSIINPDGSLSILIDEFKAGHCLGHFRSYPIVPAVFIVKCLLKGIHEWGITSGIWVKNLIEVDSLEIFPTKAMPIGLPFHADVSITKLSFKAYMFVCTINDKEQNKYGVYPITIEI